MPPIVCRRGATVEFPPVHPKRSNLYTKSQVTSRQGTRPTSTCRPGPLTGRRRFMTLCIAAKEPIERTERRVRMFPRAHALRETIAPPSRVSLRSLRSFAAIELPFLDVAPRCDVYSFDFRGLKPEAMMVAVDFSPRTRRGVVSWSRVAERRLNATVLFDGSAVAPRRRIVCLAAVRGLKPTAIVVSLRETGENVQTPRPEARGRHLVSLRETHK